MLESSAVEPELAITGRYQLKLNARERTLVSGGLGSPFAVAG